MKKQLKVNSESYFLKMLEKTKGAWNDDNWVETQKRRSKIEIAAAKKRRNEKW